MTSKCKQCGEQILDSGNYTFKIVPAKRIPRKARKLMKVKKETGVDVEDFGNNPSSFQRFLLKRAKPTNHIELTCGKCGSTSKIKMLKPNPFSQKVKTDSTTSGSSIPTPEVPSSRKRKRTKDKTAGLTIPPPAISSKRPWEPKDSMQIKDTLPKPKIVLPVQKQKSAYQKQKDMEKLKKILFDSKKAKKSGSSLEDFLSSI